jgi:large subunit ribosomal protein L17
MRKKKNIRAFGRERGQRVALIKSLMRSLVIHEGIDTTEAKAKEVRMYIEKLVTLAKKGTIASRRLVEARVGSVSAAKKLATEIAPKYEKRAGGYTRIIKLPRRQNDAAKMARIEFV